MQSSRADQIATPERSNLTPTGNDSGLHKHADTGSPHIYMEHLLPRNLAGPSGE